MDTRAFRLGLPGGLVVFELDRPALLALKEQRLAAERATCERRTIPVDLARLRHEHLVSAGFTVTRPAVFIAEGLLGYLAEPAVRQLLETLAGLAGPGSVLLADVSGRMPLNAPYLATWHARLEKAGVIRQLRPVALASPRPPRHQLAPQLPHRRS